MSTIPAPATQQANTIAREEFSGQQLEVRAETASTALAAQARAMVEARFIVAMKRPRDWDDVRARMLRACERPGFAGSATEDKVWGAAWYRKPVGDGVEGFSVRFAEEAVRCMGNVDAEPGVVTYEDDLKRMVAVAVIDLESNVAFRQTIVVEKTVERKYPKKGQVSLGQRLNSKGEVVHIVQATDDEVSSKANALSSKIFRNQVLRLLPGDIQAACRERILAIRLGDAAKDPAKVAHQVADAFATVNVLPAALKQYLGHELGTATPSELVDLRELFKAIKDGKTTWHDALAAALEERDAAPEGDTAAAAAPSTLSGFTEKLKAETAGGPAAPAPPADKTTQKKIGD